MGFIYVFVAFLFFKIMPPLLDLEGNTVVGAAVMAVVSLVVMAGMEFALIFASADWIERKKAGESVPFLPDLAWLVAVAGIAVSAATTWLVGIGFSERMMNSIGGYRSNDVLFFWIMAALPPFANTVIKLGQLRDLAKH